MADEIIGNYRLVKCILTGQSSQVWEVVETSSHRHFAMKLLLQEKEKDAEHRRLLFHEAAVGQQLAHQNISRVVTLNKNHHPPYVVMEFFPGGSMKFRLLKKQTEF